MLKPKLIILINPTSLSERFCRACLEREINLFRLYTVIPDQVYLQFNPDYFIVSKALTRNIEEDVKTVKDLAESYTLLATIPAVEYDLAYTEQLAALLSPLQSNNPHNSYLRYDKYAMNEALGQAGLHHIPQVRLRLGESIDSSVSLHFPVVIKPSSQSAGSVGVKICDDVSQAKIHLASLKEAKDPYGKKLAADIIIQEKIEGTEYFADSVSWQERHYITSIFRYQKVNVEGFPIYRYLEYVPPKDAMWKVSYDYVKQVLEVLQVKNGFGHTEFMLTANKQPYLMELNPRLSGLGGTVNFVLKLISGEDASDIYLDLVEGKQRVEPVDLDFMNQYGRIMCLFSWKEITFKGFNTAILENLQSGYYEFRSFKTEGMLISPPKDVLDMAGVAILVDKDFNKVIADTEYLQQLESKGTLFNA